MREYSKAYRAKNKDILTEKRKLRKLALPDHTFKLDKNRQLKCDHGITLEMYNQMLSHQDNRCAICGIQADAIKTALAVDHNHTTGQIRGLLCMKCNRGIGYLKDSIETLEKAKLYLESYE